MPNQELRGSVCAADWNDELNEDGYSKFKWIV
jgi:hypothetical protein